MTNEQIYLAVLKDRTPERIALDIMDIKNNNPELNRSIPYLGLCEMAGGLVAAEIVATMLSEGHTVFHPDRYKNSLGSNKTVKEMLGDQELM